MNAVDKNESKEKVAIRAGIWYTISNFLIKATSFLTTPLFARMLTKNEYGSYSNFATWISIMIIITGFDAHTSIIRYKNELSDDLESYALSALTLNSFITALTYLICLVFKNPILDVLGMEEIYLHIMFIYLIFSHAFNIMLTKNRAFYKYKLFVLLSALSVIGSAILSVILVTIMTDKLLGRILGQYLPTFLMSLIIYFLIVCNGKKVKMEYWKRVFTLCLPLIPHLLSLYILSSSDKILITKISGAEMTAIYSIAYSCVHILSILYDSMNKAWAPWLMDNLYENSLSQIRSAATPYFYGASFLALGVMLLGPEIIWILGGESYIDSILVLPPLIVGTLIQVLYTMYVNVEFYCKKTAGTAVASAIAAIINVILNIIFIPLFGYVAAAYTTLIGYIILLAIHYYLVCKLKYQAIYDRKKCFGAIFAMICMIPISLFLYKYIVIRIVCIILMICIAMYIVIRFNLFRKILKKK